MAASKTDKLVEILLNGQNVSTETLAKKTKLANVSSTINRLRNGGFNIYLNTRKRNGKVERFYRLAV